MSSANSPVPDYVRKLSLPTRSLRIGVARNPFFEDLRDGIGPVIEAALKEIEKFTGAIRDVQLPSFDPTVSELSN